MRTCPKCKAEFDDLMIFCTEDGTPLNGATVDGTSEAETKVIEGPSDNLSGAVTEVISAPEAGERTPETSAGDFPASIETQTARISGASRGTGFGMMLGALLVIGLLLLGIAIGGIFWYIRGQRPVDVATTNTGPANQLPTNVPATPSFEGSGANLSQENRVNSNSPVNLNPTVKPEPSPTPIVPDSRTTDEDEPPPPDPLPAGKPLPPRTISGGVLNGKATSLPQPAYPPAARAVGAKGTVSVQVLVDQNGNVIRAKAASGHPLLRNSAERAARNAKFSPPELGGQPVNVAGVITYVFRAN